MKIWVYLLIAILLLPCTLLSREVNIDSLEHVFKTAEHDTDKVNASKYITNYYEKTKDPAGLDFALKAYTIALRTNSSKHLYKALDQLTDSYFYFNNYQKALEYSIKTAEVARANNMNKYLVNVLNRQSYLANYLGKYDISKKALLEAIDVSEENGFKNNYARACTGYMAMAFNLGDYADAVEYGYKALSTFKELENKSLIAQTHSNLSMILGDAKEFKSSKRHANDALEIYTKEKDTLGIASIYGRIGNLYIEMKNTDSSIYYFNKQIKLAGDKIDEHDLAMVYGNLGTNYESLEEYEKALEYHFLAQKIFEKLKDDRLTAYSHMSLGNLYLKLDNINAAITNTKKAIEIIEERGEKEILYKAHGILSKAYAKKGNYIDAYKALEFSSRLKDSINNSESANKIAQLENKHTIEQKEKENELLRAKSIADEAKISASKEKEKNTKIILFAAVGGIALLSLLVIVVLRNLRRNKRKNALLNKQKEEIEIKSFQLEEALGDITDSINYAKRLQDAILPSKSVMEQIVPQSFVLFKPKDIVSGDFYWMEKLETKNLFGVFDCTGHGVPGAFMSIVGYNGLNKAVNEQKLEAPNKILDSLHESVLKTMQQDETKTVRDGMDASLCSIDYEKMTLEFAGAMNSLYHISNGEVTEIKGDKMPIGSAEKKSSYTNHKLQIQKGDVVYLFSDGYADQFGGEKGKKFKYRPFRDLLLSVSDEQPDRQLKKLETSFQSWMGTYGQVDDVCIIGVKF